MTLTTYLHNPIVAGVITGIVSAAATDLHAFKSWHSFNDARSYDWGVAAFRWFQGAILGGLSALGLSAL